jgi:hypothetical protein
MKEFVSGQNEKGKATFDECIESVVLYELKKVDL